MTDVLNANGRNGQIYFDGKTVTIKREGFLARSTQGRGDKMIPLRHIAGIQLKPAGALSNGYIQFSVPGEMSNRNAKGGRTMDATRDENAVIFLKKQQADFEILRDAIQGAIAEA